MIDCLKKDYENAQIEKTKGEIAVGLAFLFYRYWLSFGFRPAWRENSVEPLNSEKRGRELAKDAIAYAEQAYGHLREMELPQALYALNMWLNNLVEVGPDTTINEMSRLREQLQHYKDEKCWQYTYFDTIGRYYHRVATRKEDIQEREEWLRRAYRYVEQADRAVEGGDKIVRAYLQHLDDETDKIARQSQ